MVRDIPGAPKFSKNGTFLTGENRAKQENLQFISFFLDTTALPEHNEFPTRTRPRASVSLGKGRDPDYVSMLTGQSAAFLFFSLTPAPNLCSNRSQKRRAPSSCTFLNTNLHEFPASGADTQRQGHPFGPCLIAIPPRPTTAWCPPGGARYPNSGQIGMRLGVGKERR